MVMDAGKGDTQGIDSQGKRLPKWFLPREGIVSRGKMRPDILLVSNMDKEPQGNPDSEAMKPYKANCRVNIVEVGYTMDYNYHVKLQEKEEQHKLLIEKLVREGWTIGWQKSLVVGVGGTTYKETRNFLETDLGFDKKEANAYLRKIQKVAIERTEQAIKSRRHLEHGGEEGAAPQGAERTVNTPPSRGGGGVPWKPG